MKFWAAWVGLRTAIGASAAGLYLWALLVEKNGSPMVFAILVIMGLWGINTLLKRLRWLPPSR